jgi:hydroxyacylglutathione hydrolase
MQSSLTKLRDLPEETRIYAAHEYTANNLKFARAVEPDNTALAARIEEVTQLRALNTPTLPAILGVEKATNPFLRWDSPAVIKAANSRLQGASNEDVFQLIREWKDSF